MSHENGNNHGAQQMQEEDELAHIIESVDVNINRDDFPNSLEEQADGSDDGKIVVFETVNDEDDSEGAVGHNRENPRRVREVIYCGILPNSHYDLSKYSFHLESLKEYEVISKIDNANLAVTIVKFMVFTKSVLESVRSTRSFLRAINRTSPASEKVTIQIKVRPDTPSPNLETHNLTISTKKIDETMDLHEFYAIIHRLNDARPVCTVTPILARMCLDDCDMDVRAIQYLLGPGYHLQLDYIERMPLIPHKRKMELYWLGLILLDYAHYVNAVLLMNRRYGGLHYVLAFLDYAVTYGLNRTTFMAGVKYTRDKPGRGYKRDYWQFILTQMELIEWETGHDFYEEFYEDLMEGFLPNQGFWNVAQQFIDFD